MKNVSFNINNFIIYLFIYPFDVVLFDYSVGTLLAIYSQEDIMTIDGLIVSTHGEQRMKHRGITKDDVLNIMEFGDVYYVGNHCYSYYISKKAVAKLRGREKSRIGKVMDKAVIVSDDGVIVTVMRFKHPQNHWKRA